MLRVRTVQWRCGVARGFKQEAEYLLHKQGADTSKCKIDFDWWEVEWPHSRGR